MKRFVIICCFVLIFQTSVIGAFPTTGILDDFNRGDESPMTGWTDMENSLAVVSNQCKGTVLVQYNRSGYNVATYGPDCEVYISMPVVTSGGVGFMLRATTLDLGTYDGYIAWASVNGDDTRVYEVLNGSSSQIGSGDAFIFHNNDKLGGEIIGTTIKVYIWDDNGAQTWVVNSTETDATYGDAGYLGFHIFSNLAQSDDFGGGTIGAPPPTGGQFIMIQMSMIPLFLIFTLVCFIRGKEIGK